MCVVKNCPCECLALMADTSRSGAGLSRELTSLLDRRAAHGGQRQWRRADLVSHPALVAVAAGRVALYRAGRADAVQL